MENKVILLNVNGTREVLSPEQKPTLQQMQGWVGGYIETIRVQYGNRRATLVVNEEGLAKNLPVNSQASRIAGFSVGGNAFILCGWRL